MKIEHHPASAGTQGLAQAIARIAVSDGDFPTAIPALSLHRRKGPTEPLHCIFSLGLGVVAQGHKQVLLGEEVITYGPGQSLLTTIDLPVISHVTRASPDAPLLGLMLTLDPQRVVDSAAALRLAIPARLPAYRPVSRGTLDEPMIATLVRLVRLLEEPALMRSVAPLIQQEIVVRLLLGSHGPQLLHLAASGSPRQQIAKALAWLKLNFRRELKVDALAARAHMSPSTFRQHFRSITGTSPVQYQKQLRLQEARQLMLNRNMQASNASGLVGYESASQFSREYSRLFGAPPQQDVRRMRLANESGRPPR
jgi:AraC-like DNA-binding protein